MLDAINHTMRMDLIRAAIELMATPQRNQAQIPGNPVE